MNTLKITVLMMGLVLLLGFIGFYFGGQGGLIIALSIAIIMNVGTYWFSDKVVLKMYRAKEVTEHEQSRLYRIVRQITTKAMIPMPKVYIVPSKAPNAFATGRNAEHSAVAATEGLLELLNDRELEGVFGHELAHIQNNDMLIGTIAATFAGAIGIISSMVRWGAIFGGFGSRDDDRGGLVGLIVGAIVAPIAAMLIQMAISRTREFKADKVGAEMTGRYRELASALEKLHRSPVKMNLNRRPATAHMMISNPLSGKGITSLFSTHPPVEQRIEHLKKLEQESLYSGHVTIG